MGNGKWTIGSALIMIAALLFIAAMVLSPFIALAVSIYFGITWAK